VGARLEIVLEDLVDDLDVVEQSPDQNLFVRRQTVEGIGKDRIQAVGRPTLAVDQSAIGKGKHRKCLSLLKPSDVRFRNL
jgi:hypothetical protein